MIRLGPAGGGELASADLHGGQPPNPRSLLRLRSRIYRQLGYYDCVMGHENGKMCTDSTSLKRVALTN